MRIRKQLNEEKKKTWWSRLANFVKMRSRNLIIKKQITIFCSHKSVFSVENSDLYERPSLSCRGFSIINDKPIVIKGQGRTRCFHLEEILLCSSACKRTFYIFNSSTSLKTCSYTNVKKNSFLYYISSFATGN